MSIEGPTGAGGFSNGFSSRVNFEGFGFGNTDDIFEKVFGFGGPRATWNTSFAAGPYAQGSDVEVCSFSVFLFLFPFPFFL